MRLRHVPQRNRSTGCGPACVAIVARVTYERARREMWGDQTRSLRSYYPQLRRALKNLKAWGDPRPVRMTSFESAKGLSIFACRLKLHETDDGHVRRWHWVVYDPERGLLYDPSHTAPLELDADELDRRYRPFSSMRVRRRHLPLRASP